MKLVGVILFIVGLHVCISPKIYASDISLVEIEVVDGEASYHFEHAGDRIYLTFDGSRLITTQIYHVGYFDSIVNIHHLYQTFVIVDARSQNVLKEFTQTDMIVIDGITDVFDGRVYIRSGEENFVWDIYGSINLNMYFLNDTPYEPVFETVEFHVDVDETYDLSYFKEYFLAWDDTDGNLTEQIIVKEDAYTGNEKSVGSYTVILEVSDQARNTASMTIIIHVEDYVAPSIEQLDKIVLSYTEVFDAKAWLDTLTIVDNHDEFTDLHIEVIRDTYEEKIGVYEIELLIQDTSMNQTSYIQLVEVIDDVAPVIEGQIEYEKSTTDHLSTDDIIAQLSIYDEKSQVTVKVLFDYYTAYEKKVGTYTFVVEAIDISHNRTTQAITIYVVDQTPPIFVINLGMITMDQKLQYDEANLLSMIQSHINHDYDKLDIVKNEYEQQTNTPGVYRVILSMQKTTSEQQYQILVRVQETSVIVPIDKKESIPIYVIGLITFSLVIGIFGLSYIYIRRKKRFN